MTTRPELRRRGTLIAASLVCMVLCAGCGEAHFPAALGPARPLAVAVVGPASALYAPLYEARSDGAFKLGALTVTIAPQSQAAALAALESDAASVAIVSEPALLAARDGGEPLVAIGALVGQPLDGIVSLQARPVASAATLSGRTVAVAPSALARAELATALSRAHVAPAAVRQVALGGDTATTLGHGGVAATIGADYAFESAALQQAHRSAHVLDITQAGVPPYSALVIVVRVGEAHYDGPLLRAFLQSLTRGERAVTAAPPAATAAMLARINPSLDKAFETTLLAQLQVHTPVANAKHPFGYQDPYQWQTFGAWMLSHGLIRRNSESGLAITDEFLPGVGEQTVSGD
jgi:putative hydroxymethylpyrimidine transport system substrate-binding protein